jgi:hypothetical protein
MTTRVTGPDGSIFNFPDDLAEAEIQSVLDRHYNPPGAIEDVAKAGASGALTGAVSTAVGIPGTLASLTNQAGDFLARQTVGRAINAYRAGSLSGALDSGGAVSQPDPGLAPPSIGPEATLPTVSSVAEKIPQYQPQTTAGQYAKSAGEMLGGNMVLPVGSAGARAFAGITGGLGAEAAGQLTERLGHPELAPYARVAATLAAPAMAGRVVTPFRTDPNRLAAAERLRAENIPVSAGQQTGNRVLQYMESGFGESPGGVMAAEGQQQAFNAAVSRRMLPEGAPGVPALTPDVMKGRADEISQAYNDVLSRNALQYDLPLGNDIVGTLGKYRDRVQLAQRADLERNIGRLNADIVANQGALTGEQYQQARSFFGQQARDFRGKDSAYSRASGDIKKALDAAWERSATASGNLEDVAAKRALDRNYRAQDTITKALANSQNAALGDVNPFVLGGAARTAAGTNAAVRGQDELSSLASTARTIMRPPPNSGTAARQQILGLPQAIGIGGGALAGGPIGGLAGYFAPGAGSWVLNTRPGQAYLGNTLLNEGVLTGARALANVAQAGKGILSDRERRR